MLRVSKEAIGLKLSARALWSEALYYYTLQSDLDVTGTKFLDFQSVI